MSTYECCACVCAPGDGWVSVDEWVCLCQCVVCTELSMAVQVLIE